MRYVCVSMSRARRRARWGFYRCADQLAHEKL